MSDSEIVRKKEIARIKTRMKELNYNQRSLSLKATGKEDSVRNLFRGTSRNWRMDTYKAVMAVLWPEEEQPSPAPKQEEIALIKTIEALIRALLIRRILPAADLEGLFNSQLRDFRKRDQLSAAAVMDQLLDFLHSEFPVSASPADSKSFAPSQGRSKKEKSLKN